MAVKMAMLLTYCIIFTLLDLSQCIFLPYWKSKNHTEDSFHVPMSGLVVGNSKAKPGSKLEFLQNTTRRYSLDERCSSGKVLSIAWHPYAPYVIMYESKYNNKRGFTVGGMLPGILTKILRTCCHANSTVQYGKLLRSVRHGEETFSQEQFDITFPLYGYDGFRHSFRDHPFLPLVRAPRVILLVHDNQSQSRTHFVVTTIVSAWPMLVFILVTASLSGIIIWFLDHTQNPSEFPPPFLRGAWEGFWWALVTMTTVGYGDRSPKSALGRVFCIIWIITGVIIVSIFTALVTASLSASTYPNFKIHGSKLGAVNGSEEYRLGVSMNADMKVYSNVMQITKDLLKNDIDGALVDNYIITHFLKFIQDSPIRVEKYIEHPIVFGAVLSRNSSRLEKCMRQYSADYPHEMFESIAAHLTPLKNPTDEVSQQVKAAEALFYQESVFTTIMICGLGIVGSLFIAGMIYEFAFRRRNKIKQRMGLGPKVNFNSTDEEAKLQIPATSQADKIDDMIYQYQMFHDDWIENLKKLRDQCSNGNVANGSKTTDI